MTDQGSRGRNPLAFFVLCIDNSIRLRYYKYVLKRSTDLIKGDGVPDRCSFIFHNIYNKKEGSTDFGVALFL